MSNAEIEQIIDTLLAKITMMDQKIEDLKNLVIWKERGIVKTGAELEKERNSQP
jgi:hypothetical protein